MMADVRILQEQSQQMQNLIGALNATLSEALKAVNTRLDEQAGNNRKSFADQKLIIDTLSSDLKVVREKVDDNNVRIGSLSQEVDALRQGLQQLSAGRPAARHRNDGRRDRPRRARRCAAERRRRCRHSRSAPRRNGLYEQASGSYSAGLYDLAIEGFQAYIRSFPKSDMADDAQLQIGTLVSGPGQERQGGGRVRQGDSYLPGRQRRSPTPTTRRGSRWRTSNRSIWRAPRSKPW